MLKLGSHAGSSDGEFPEHSLTSEDTGSVAALNTALAWMEICSIGHSSCNIADQLHPLPTRILDVFPEFLSTDYSTYQLSNCQEKFTEAGSIPSSANSLDVRLRSNINENARYVCLSHCWGNKQPIRLLKSNKDKMEKRISWAELPLTFQEAIQFTRSLKVRYIWIDSLCIIQDDKEDWLRESVSMHLIFRHSYLTIGATKSSNPEQGLFSKAPFRSQAYRIPTNHSSISDIYIRKELSHRLGDPEEGDPIPPLLKRAWVYQERLLSSRFLHFTEDELVWECNSGTACECHPQIDQYPWWSTALAPTETFLKVTHFGNDVFSHVSHDSGWPHISNWPQVFIWHRIVSEYSLLQLTFPEDRLPALAGIIAPISLRTGLDHVQGLWLESLLVDLLWFVDPDARHPARRHTKPSWSWTSIMAPVLYDFTHENLKLVPDATVVHPKTNPNRSTDPSAPFRSGTTVLVISGKLLPCKIEQDSKHNWAYHLKLDADITLQNEFCSDEVLDLETSSEYYALLLVRNSYTDVASGDYEPPSFFDSTPYVQNFGLVLAAEQLDQLSFRRIGYFSHRVNCVHDAREARDGFYYVDPSMVRLL